MSYDAKNNTNAVPSDTPESSYSPGADLSEKRKVTLADYLNAATEGSQSKYTDTSGEGVDENPITGNQVSIDASFANRFPVNNSTTQEISVTDFETGLPAGTTFDDGSERTGEADALGQAHFTSMNAARAVFNEISSGIFFDKPVANTVAGLVQGGLEDVTSFKNHQRFGHGVGTDTHVQTLGSAVSSVLLNNRFAPTIEAQTGTTLISSETEAQTAFRTQEGLSDENTRTAGTEGQYYFNAGLNDEIGDNQQGPKNLISSKLATLGLEATLAASGYTVGPSVINTAWGDSWEGAFAQFGIKEIVGQASKYGLEAAQTGDLLNTGTARVGERVTNPTREWIQRGDGAGVNPDDLVYIDSSGRPTGARVDATIGAGSHARGSKEALSFGVMNNYIDQFQGDLFGRQYVQSLTFILGIFVQNLLYAAALDVLLVLEFLTDEDQRKNLQNQYKMQPGTRLAKGKARGYVVPRSELKEPYSDGLGLTADILELFGIPDLTELFSGPVLVELVFNFLGIQKPVGTKTYFEIKDFPVGRWITSFIPSYTVGSLQTLISAVKDPMSGGFFNNLGRQVVRKSAEQSPPPSSSDENGFLDYFLNLREQAAFRFFKTMVDLGDNSINNFFYELKNLRQPAKVSYDPVKNAIFNTRAAHGARTIHPTSIAAATSAFLIPKSFINARGIAQGLRADAIGDKGKFLSGYSVHAKSAEDSGFEDQFINQKKDGVHKLDPVLVDQVEAMIEADYMPFYIKDMRTNEIIGFHAFLNNLTDGFQASYQGIKGMGRIEEAPIYTSTSRSISVGFTMMAFSPEDMDMLYWKLNKLVTLMYPQWSKGTKMIGGPEGKKPFYMPFSQIPTASPLVRLRIGDLLTSNYSSMSAARLLGLGYKETMETAENAEDGLLFLKKSDPAPAGLPPVPGLAAPQRRNPLTPDQAFNVGFKTSAPSTIGVIGPLIKHTGENTINVGDELILHSLPSQAQIGKLKVAPTPLTGGFVTNKGIANVHVGYLPSPVIVYKCIGYTLDIDGETELSKTSTNFKIKCAIMFSRYQDPFTGGNTAAAAAKGIKLTESQKEQVALIEDGFGMGGDKLVYFVDLDQIKAGVGGAIPLDEAAVKFVVNNTISKAFDNTRGAGLAGVIENFTIDWGLNEIMWDTSAGKRAPQGCRVTLNFKPIHDITPGIDADGLNRAPVYSVGKHSRNLGREHTEALGGPGADATEGES